jgi:CheY-like chemotaxis protein
VLVIEGDESTAASLARALEEKGYVVDVCREAMVGFRKACETVPDCIVLSPELPDIDGAWVARRVRTEAGSIAKVPILFVGELTDRNVRTQTLNVGADVFLARPISNDEIVAQLGALIAMAWRLGGKEADGSSPSSLSVTAAIRGDLSAFPLASLLMMFEMERRSGTVDVVAQSGKRASLTLTDGLFASTSVGGAPRPALEVLREVLSWRAGRFSFGSRENGSGPPSTPRASVGALVLEAMRLEDEEKSPAMQELDSDDLIEAPSSVRREEVRRDEKHRTEDSVQVRPSVEHMRIPPRPKAAP